MIYKKIISNVQKYLLCFLIALAGCNPKGKDKISNLISIEITPLEATIAISEKQQFTATGTYSDKSTRDLTSSVTWYSSNFIAASVTATGLATGITAGSAQITAMLGHIRSSVARLNVTNEKQDPQEPKIKKIEITTSNTNIFVHETLQFNAIATYSDDHVRDVTNEVKWNSSDSKILSISQSTGTAIGNGQGEVQVSAVLGSIISNVFTVKVKDLPSQKIVKIEITAPAYKIFTDRTLQFNAIAIYSDSSARDVTSEISWLSSDITVAAFSQSPGVAVGVGEGETQISASFGSVFSNIFTLTIEQPKLLKIEVLPNKVDILIGNTQQFKAIANYSDKTSKDVTSKVKWKSSNLNVAKIGESSGLATTVYMGTTEISASLDLFSSEKAQLNILPRGMYFKIANPSCKKTGFYSTRIDFEVHNNDKDNAYKCSISSRMYLSGNSSPIPACGSAPGQPADSYGISKRIQLQAGTQSRETSYCEKVGDMTGGYSFTVTIGCKNQYSEEETRTVSGTCDPTNPRYFGISNQ